MKDNPETVLYDYKYDCIDNSDVYTLDENPCNSNFFTERPADWLRGCISYYNGLYTKGELNTNLRSRQLGAVSSCEFVVKTSRNVR